MEECCTATEGQQLPVPKTETCEQGLEGCIGVGQQGQASQDLIGNSAPGAAMCSGFRGDGHTGLSPECLRPTDVFLM